MPAPPAALSRNASYYVRCEKCNSRSEGRDRRLMFHLFQGLGSNILLALGTVTLAQVMAPAAAQAQCNSSINPAPPPPVVANFFNQTFGNTRSETEKQHARCHRQADIPTRPVDAEIL